MQTIKLNLIPQGVNPTCFSSQYDTGRVIRVLLFEGVTPYTLSNSESVSLSVRKPDNTLVTTSVVNTEADYVDIVTTEQMTAVTGVSICELRITEGSKDIGTLNFNMQVELAPTAHGIPSGSALDNLQEQVNACVEVALEELYDGTSVSFDSEPVADHDAPYTVTSAGIKTALDTKANLSDLNNYYTKTQVDNTLDALTASDIAYDNSNTGLTADDTQEAIDEVLSKVPVNASGLSYSNTQSGLTADDVQEAIDELASQSTDVSFTSNQNDGNKIGELTIDGVTTDLYTGELSTVGALDDLTDVDTTGKADGDNLRYNGSEWVAKPNTIALTQNEYNNLSPKPTNTHYVITDGQNVTCNLGDLTDVDTTGASTGDILVKGATGWESQTPTNQSIDKIGEFLLGKSGDTKTGDITLSESIANARALIFTISLGMAANPIRASLTVPIYALVNYGVFQDYTIGSDRNYWSISKTNNTKLSVSGTSIASSSNFYLNVWIVR